MLLQLQQQLSNFIREAVQQSLPQCQTDFNIKLERPKQAAHGDIACNIAMQLAKANGLKPRDLAEQIVQHLMASEASQQFIQNAEIAGPGFINLRLHAHVIQEVINVIREQGQEYGNSQLNPQKLIVEFVSANPTGPLHVGHARQAALGDCICNLFTATGAQVHREYYYNDAGNQIDNLALSVQARLQGIQPDDAHYPADGYRGEYIQEIAEQFKQKATVNADDQSITASGNTDNIEDIRRFAVAYLRREQDMDLKAFNLQFDRYYLESSLYSDGLVEQVVQTLTQNGYVYEKDNALWLKTTELGTGDDKDRVMRKTDGGYTYFVPDVAYHLTKWQRGYHHAINIQGSDHHGTVARVRAGLQGLEIGIPKTYPSYILHKMVKVTKGGQEVKISKRAGSYVTMRDLIDWVGQDAVRFFLIQRRADTEFVFDIDLALSKSEENPVYYVQYAHARICKILRDCQADAAAWSQADLSLLTANSEINLLKRLAELPSLIQTAAQELAPHHIAFWLLDCAADFHAWYNDQRIIVEDDALRLARLALADASRQVLANGLNLLGVSAPEQM
ncbi:arginine--tRNA ligase [Brackiella oedipodis]|uniref:arginine--tRNA ligase n=1 Tax=Brackiella oedipodis TaxID=124225 RepID=UPI00048C5BB2|nr:arginine--tRNA ligase [Brackiella oedipodis]